MQRCDWCSDDPLYCDYHDNEWGVPLHDSHALFELLNLEGMQAGLSWITVLKKRTHYRKVFDNFHPEKVARYSPEKVESLLQDPGIIRNRLKVNAIITNAKAYCALANRGIDFHDFIWETVEGNPITHHWKNMKEIPASTPLSDTFSKRLKNAGFKFVGSTICYAFMQAAGLVDDHLLTCYKRQSR